MRRKEKSRVETTINPEVYTSTSGTAVTPENIIDSDSGSAKDISTGQAFRKYRYTQVNIKLAATGKVIVVCIDSGCEVSLIDEAIMNQFLPDTPIRTMAAPIEVSGIGSDRHQTDRYVIAPLYIPGKDNNGDDDTARTAPQELHIVNGLPTGILIGNDIITPERIDLLVSQQVTQIRSCKVKATIETLNRRPLIRRVVHSKKDLTLPPHTETTVLIHHLNLPDRDFFFEPSNTKLSMYAEIINMDTGQVLVKNDSNVAVHISRNMRLGEAVGTQFDGCFHITTGQEDIAELATRRPAQEHEESWVKTMFKRAVTAGAVALLTITGQTSSTSSGGATGLTQSSTSRVAGEPVINKELSNY